MWFFVVVEESSGHFWVPFAAIGVDFVNGFVVLRLESEAIMSGSVNSYQRTIHGLGGGGV
jgi:hypothetical protein